MSKSSQRVGIPDIPLNAAELHVGSGVLYDLVVLATSSSGNPDVNNKMSPLCDDIPKAMLPIGGRPLIWHCLRHWIDNGVRQVFLCLHEYDRVDIERCVVEAFKGVTFHIVQVKPDLEEGIPSSSCHALAAYRDFKKNELRGTASGAVRDVMVVHCDTILTKVDLQPFVMNFYANLATVGVLLWRVGGRIDPQEGADAAAKGGKGSSSGGGKKKGAGQEHLELKKYSEDLCCVMAEPDTGALLVAPPFVNAPMTSSSSGKQQQQLVQSKEEPLLEHLRLHFLEYEAEELRVSVGFAARRPNLICFADVSDTGVYLLRPIALDYIIKQSTEDPTLSLDIDLIPMLARSQHALINEEKEKALTPADKLSLEDLRGHWSQAAGSIGMFNSMPAANGAAFMQDTLKVVCTVLNERVEAPSSSSRAFFPPTIRRISSTDAYVAVCHELLSTFVSAAQLCATADLSSTIPQMQSLRDACCFANTPSLFRYSSTGVAVLDELVSGHLHAQPSNRVVDSIVLSPTHETSYIKNSIIGKGVVLGKDCRITNCILLDNVEIGDKTTLTNVVIGGGAEVQKGQVLSATVVAPRTVVGGDER